jgi:MarR family transcriptional regulator, lower aerobic nicotinate degradation pathway regulator
MTVRSRATRSATNGSPPGTLSSTEDPTLVAVLDSIRYVVRTLRISGRAAEQTVGVSGAQLFVLQQLARSPAQSLNELAERTLTHQSSVSVVVSRLVSRRLVARTVSSEDARRIVLTLTPAGRALLARAPEAAQARLVGGLRRLPPREARALARGLRALVDVMERGEYGDDF